MRFGRLLGGIWVSVMLLSASTAGAFVPGVSPTADVSSGGIVAKRQKPITVSASGWDPSTGLSISSPHSVQGEVTKQTWGKRL